MTLDILDAKRANTRESGRSFSLRNRLYRGLWNVVWIVFASWTPPIFHGWRRFLLRLFGAEIGEGAGVYGSARIWSPANLKMGKGAFIGPRVTCYSIAEIMLHEFALVSQGAHLCTGTHDIRDPHFQLVAAPITIGARSWIAAEAFVGPGVKVGEGCVLGARAVAFGNLDPWSVYVGNPARKVGSREKLQFSSEIEKTTNALSR